VTKNEMTKNEAAMIRNAFTMRRELIERMLDETRDLNLECGYPEEIKTGDYQAMYDRNEVASRVVKLMPEECWNAFPEVAENDEPEETEFEKTWKTLIDEHHVYNYLQRIDVLSGVGRFGLLLLGVSDGKSLNEPVEKKSLDLIYLRPFGEHVVNIKERDKEVTSPRYGLPVLYGIRTENLDGTLSSGTTDIHWTRVIHVADNREMSEIFGTPRMKQVYDRLLDLKKLLGGSAEMFWKGGFPGYAFEMDKDRKKSLTDAEKKSLKAEFLNFSNKLQRYIALVGVTAKSLTPQVADPKSHFEIQLKAIGIALGVPYRVFMGSEEAKLASMQDVKTWNRRVSKRRESYLTPMLIRPFVDRLVEFGVLPETKRYFVKWPKLDVMDEKDAAAVTKDKTEALAKYVTAGADAILPPFQFLTTVMGYDDEEAKTIIGEAEEWLNDRESEDEE